VGQLVGEGEILLSGFTGNGASGGDIPVAKSKYKVYFKI
jgi:hypothetical protein